MKDALPSEPRRRGRPTVANPLSESLHVKLTQAQFDQLARFAFRQNIPVATFVRLVLFRDFESRL